MGEAKNGTVSWVDLSTPNIGGSQRFYRELFGWHLDVQRTPMGEYTVASAADREVAGMMAQSSEAAGMPATWTVFVVVENMETTLAQVESAGGKVHQTPFEIPGGARVSVVADRTRAMFALISGGAAPDYPYYSDDIGAVCWVELMTSDVPAAVEFYAKVFGWTADSDDVGPVRYTTCRAGDDPMAGIIGRPENVPEEVPDGWSVYFSVADCETSQDRAIELGGSVVLPATPTPVGPFAVLADPAGAAFQIMEISTVSVPTSRPTPNRK